MTGEKLQSFEEFFASCSPEWRPQHVGKRILHFSCVDSTNTLAQVYAVDRRYDGLILLADYQKAGRGRQQRRWYCPPGKGVLMSVVVFPPATARQPAILTAWAAVSVCRTIYRLTGREAWIKWPNDVMIMGKKVCGVLVEQTGAVIAGIGMNVSTTREELDNAGLHQATSLAAVLSPPPSVRQTALELVRNLDDFYQQICAGQAAQLEALWRWYTDLTGRRVRIEQAAGTLTGTLLECTFERLLVQDERSRLHSLPPEQVLHVVALDDSSV